MRVVGPPSLGAAEAAAMRAAPELDGEAGAMRRALDWAAPDPAPPDPPRFVDLMKLPFKLEGPYILRLWSGWWWVERGGELIHALRFERGEQ